MTLNGIHSCSHQFYVYSHLSRSPEFQDVPCVTFFLSLVVVKTDLAKSLTFFLFVSLFAVNLRYSASGSSNCSLGQKRGQSYESNRKLCGISLIIVRHSSKSFCHQIACCQQKKIKSFEIEKSNLLS